MPSRIVARVVVLSALVVGLVACSQFKVQTRHDPGADFSRLRTFAWLPLDQAEPADQRVLDRAVDARIRARVDAELRGKGFMPAGDAGPDFFLNYRLSTSPDSGVRGVGIWMGWPGAEGIYSESYDVGTLYLATVDPRTRHMTWLGAAEARLLPHISIERRLKRVDAVIHRILADFPPR